MSGNDNGITGTDGAALVASVSPPKRKVKKPCLWVSYRAMASNGMLMSSDGFYEGTVPVTMAMLMQIKSEITAAVQNHLNSVKPVDAQGKIIVGVPKPQVRTVEICAITAAEIEEEVAVN